MRIAALFVIGCLCWTAVGFAQDEFAQEIVLTSGSITAVGQDSITISEEEGRQIVLSIKEGTTCVGPQGLPVSVKSLAVGQRVTVSYFKLKSQNEALTISVARQ